MSSDPGRQYLYSSKQKEDTAPAVARLSSERDRWDIALGNVADANVLFAKLQSMLSDALFLDEDTFNGKKDVQYYVQKLKVTSLRVRELESELQAALGALTEKDSHLDELRKQMRGLQQQLIDEQQTQENTAQVFQVHAEAIRQKDEEIQRLKTVIEGLTS